MHADDVEEGLAVDVEAGEGSALGCSAPLVERRGGDERRAVSAMRADCEISLAAHDGGEGGGEVAAGVGVIGQAEGHQQRAEVGVAEAERAVVVRVVGDLLGRIAGVVDEDLLRGDHDVDGVAKAATSNWPSGATNFIRLKRPGCRRSRRGTCTREQGFEALMRAVFLQVCQRLMVVSYCMPGSPHCQVASAILRIRSRALVASSRAGRP